jgi:hypothetical protein
VCGFSDSICEPSVVFGLFLRRWFLVHRFRSLVAILPCTKARWSGMFPPESDLRHMTPQRANYRSGQSRFSVSGDGARERQELSQDALPCAVDKRCAAGLSWTAATPILRLDNFTTGRRASGSAKPSVSDCVPLSVNRLTQSPPPPPAMEIAGAGPAQRKRAVRSSRRRHYAGAAPDRGRPTAIRVGGRLGVIESGLAGTRVPVSACAILSLLSPCLPFTCCFAAVGHR